MRLVTILSAVSLLALLSAAPAADPKPVQSLQLLKTEKLDGLITLANHNTLLFIPDAEKHDVRVMAVSAEGKRLWESSIIKVRHMRGLVGIVQTIKGGDPETRSTLFPVRAHSIGNTVYTCEPIFETSVIGDKIPLGMKEGQLVVQQITEDGKVTRHDFTQPEPPNKVSRSTMGSYADTDGLYLVTEYSDARAETTKYYLERYNPATKKSQQLALDLPQPYVTKGKAEVAYNNWILGGHRDGKTYFYRALRGTTTKDNPNKIPVEYEFRIYDNNAAYLGGFATKLHQQMKPNTFINYSGSLTHYPLQGHVPHYESRNLSTKGRWVDYDVYDATTGGLGEIHIDPTSDDIYIGGEYAAKPFDVWSPEKSTGAFMFQLKPDGKIVSAAQNEYSVEVKKDNRFLTDNFFYDRRYAFLYVDPISHDVSMEFEQAKRNVLVTYEAGLKHVSHRTMLFKEEPIQSFWLISQSYSTAGNLGGAQMTFSNQAAATAKTGYGRKLFTLAERTKPSPKTKVENIPYYSFVPHSSDAVLVIRAAQTTGSRVDIYSL